MTNLEKEPTVESKDTSKDQSRAPNYSRALFSILLLVVSVVGFAFFVDFAMHNGEQTYVFKLDNGDGSYQQVFSDTKELSLKESSNDWLDKQIGCRYADTPADYTQRLRKASGTIDRIFDHKTVVTYKASESVTSTLYFTVKEVPDRIFSMSENRLCEGTFYSGSIGAPVYAFGLAQPGDKVDLYYIDDDLNARRPNPDHVRYLLGFDDATTGIKGYAPWYVRKLAAMNSEHDPAPAK